jgi:hypothetical protein
VVLPRWRPHAIAQASRWQRYRKLRSDGTVVETNTHYPTDSTLPISPSAKIAGSRSFRSSLPSSRIHSFELSGLVDASAKISSSQLHSGRCPSRSWTDILRRALNAIRRHHPDASQMPPIPAMHWRYGRKGPTIAHAACRRSHGLGCPIGGPARCRGVCGLHPRQEPFRPPHIRPVFLPESLDHHLLFLAHAPDEARRRHHCQEHKAPLRAHQGQARRKTAQRSIHGMPHPRVRSVSHELVPGPQLELR